MADEQQNSPIKRWIEANRKSENFGEALKQLLAFACADWFRRASGQIVSPEAALAQVIAASLTEFPMGTWLESPNLHTAEIADFCEKIKILPLPSALTAEFPKVLDLRGVKCPNNAARSRLVLAGAPAGAHLDIYLDEGSPIENVPQAVIADGHIVEKREKKGDFWVLSVVKGKARV